ncbi:hypothetical protein SLEP1_g37949 [Rubroshorea leprosula]|uniref:Uncharacterized protein n=1 Tax=Rubroshorea leprosula TaxID=152421 RepID=A0AAV5KWF7_9ROSI|nr:hypothetical protein SLEP1_g37949 [Rubroshorea leprosula]
MEEFSAIQCTFQQFADFGSIQVSWTCQFSEILNCKRPGATQNNASNQM